MAVKRKSHNNPSAYKLFLFAALAVGLLYVFSTLTSNSLSSLLFPAQQQQHHATFHISDESTTPTYIDIASDNSMNQSPPEMDVSNTSPEQSEILRSTEQTQPIEQTDELTAAEEQQLEKDYDTLDGDSAEAAGTMTTTESPPPPPAVLPPPSPSKKVRQPKPARGDLPQKRNKPVPTKGNTIHVLMTSGGGSYQNYQARIHYSSFKNVQKLPGGDRMVAFTRILHRSHTDELVHEIPTFHARPLQEECSEWCDYPVSDRAHATQQFFNASEKDPDLIRAPWILLTETDYVWLKPLKAPMAENLSARPVAYEFGYMEPDNPSVAVHLQKFYVGARNRKRGADNPDFRKIPKTGPAPALMRIAEWKKVLPEWIRVTARIENDEAAKVALDWIREMYAFCVAVDIENIQLDLRKNNPIMIQPPHETNLMSSVVLIHYTWGVNITDSKQTKVEWFWDKREVYEREDEVSMPLLPELPPFDPGFKFDYKEVVGKKKYEVLQVFVEAMNGAIRSLSPHPNTTAAALAAAEAAEAESNAVVARAKEDAVAADSAGSAQSLDVADYNENTGTGDSAGSAQSLDVDDYNENTGTGDSAGSAQSLDVDDYNDDYLE